MTRFLRTLLFALLFAAGTAAHAAGPTGLLNDTGQDTCYDGSAMVACSAANSGDGATYPRQDGRFGRDAAQGGGQLPAKTGGGAAGFDYSKVCFNGDVEGSGTCTGTLVANTTATATGVPSTDWACTRDNVTNLIWSLESGYGDWTTYANTTLPNATNLASRCGFSSGWRLPTRRELQSIVHYGVTNPSIDGNYFPNTQSSNYWSSESDISTALPWGVYFQYGTTFTYLPGKPLPYNGYVRLVHGTLPSPTYTDHGDGTVTDTVSGLMWDKCSWGQAGDTDCSGGSATTHTWQQALAVAVNANASNYKGYNDWRLPNVRELESLLKYDTSSPAIDGTVFPNTQSSSYWSATISLGHAIPFSSYQIYFGNGITNAGVHPNYYYYVRLVRSGQSFGDFDALATDTPDAFSFTDQTGVALSSTMTSTPVQITGINSAASWTATGGIVCVSSGNDCSCGVATYGASGTVSSGQYLCARHTSSGSFSTQTDTQVTVGGVSDTFSSTTLPQTSYTGNSATGTGTVTANLSGGGANCGFTSAQFVTPSVAPPSGVSFPDGLFDFTLSNCTPGSTVTVTVTWPGAAGLQYWKYGPTPGNGTPHWYTIPATITGNTTTFSITDGGTGDDDLTANGTIVDQGGPGVVMPVPSLTEWGMMLLAGLLGLFGVGAVRRRA